MTTVMTRSATVGVLLAVIVPGSVFADVLYPLDLFLSGEPLVGTYEFGQAGGAVPLIGHLPSAEYDTALDWSEVVSVRVVIDGTLDAGVVRGDGIVRPAEEAALLTSFRPGIGFAGAAAVADELFSSEYVEEAGQFHMEWSGPAPDAENGWLVGATTTIPPHYFYGPCPVSDQFALTLSLLQVADLSRMTLPEFFDPPSEDNEFCDLMWWAEGLDIVEPATLTISGAYIVLEVVPEPCTMALLLPGLMLLHRLRRRSRRDYGRCG